MSFTQGVVVQFNYFNFKECVHLCIKLGREPQGHFISELRKKIG
jgi:hypothetical protein